MPKSINFNSLRLRTKLLMLAALPLLGLVATSGLLVRNSFTSRTEALNEQIEITRVGLAANLTDALVLERERTRRSTTNQFRLDEARADVDAAIEAYRAQVEGDVAMEADILLLTDEINQVRSELGDLDSMISAQRMAQVFVFGVDAATFELLDTTIEHALALTNAQPGAVVNERTSINARSVLLLADYNASLRAEFRAYVDINEAVDLSVADNARGDAFRLSGHVEQVESQLLAIQDDAVSAEVQELIDSPIYSLVAGIRERVATNFLNRDLAPAGSFLPALEPLFQDIAELQDRQVQQVQDEASVRADSAVTALIVSALSTAAFILVMALLVAALFRSIRAPLLSLTEQSRNISKTQLPNVVAQIRELGGDAQVEMPAPIVAESDDEVGELVDAFNQLHTTAVELAAEQAASRRTVSEMFVNLGRRNQKILMRLLASLEKLERNERDPEVLHELFRVDHLATRMRRNAESLLVLAGAKTSRSFGEAITVGDVVRSALSEVEDYERVTFQDDANARINGKAVADIGHLLAELIENALMFSPPTSSVEVHAAQGPEGLMITVGDRGIGLTEAELQANNQRILDAAARTETPSRFLGLYVVGRLAHRHDLKVELLNGVPSGLIARIKLPAGVYQSIGPVEEVVEDEVLVRHEPTPEALPAAIPAEPTAPDSYAPTSFAAVEPPAQPEPVAETSPGPDTFAPPAPAHRRANPAPALVQRQPQVAPEPAPQPQVAPAPLPQPQPAPMPAAAEQQTPAPFTTARRTPKARQASDTTDANVPTPVAAPRFDPNKNLSGFQRSVPAAESAERSVPVERRRPIPGQENPLPVRGATPAPAPVAAPAPEPAAPAAFAPPKRVPGASSLSRKVNPVAPTDRSQTPAVAEESTPQSAARFGANLAGFQRGVQRADTPTTAETVEESVTSSSPLANNGEIS